VAAICLAAAPSASADIVSTFNSDNEGWQVTQGDYTTMPDPYTDLGPAPWIASGNPGGSINFVDADSGEDGINSFYGFFLGSAEEWSGDFSAYVGGHLSFDQTANIAGEYGPLVLFLGSSACVAWVDSPLSVVGINHYSVDLTTANLLDCQTNSPPTQGTLNAALADVVNFEINPDDSTAASETEALDNVVLTPGSGGGTVSRSLTLSYSKKKDAFKGKLKAPDATACAAGQKVTVFKKDKGPDTKIGKATTKPSGSYSVGDTGKKGTYYSKTPKSTVGVHTCKAAKSPPLDLGKAKRPSAKIRAVRLALR
jgi:hypothetical protein